MKKGVFYTNGFKPLGEIIRIMEKTIPDCSSCPFNDYCVMCMWKEILNFLYELQEIENRK